MKQLALFVLLGTALAINLRTEDGRLAADVERLAADLYELQYP
jgi:hypothetical protein